MTEKEKAIEWLTACKETNYRHSPTIQGYIDMAIANSNFLNFLVNVIPPNEMEKYREMYNCSSDKNNC